MDIPAIIVFGIIVLIGIVLNVKLYKSRRRDKLNLERDWLAFLEFVKQENIVGIKSQGEILIYNRNLTKQQLLKLRQIVQLRIERHPELESLRLLAFNKKLYHGRRFSGGVQ